MTRENRMTRVDDYYDVVVIGSGLGGLTGAHCLAKEGYSVLLLEQHYQLGGLATWFKRRGGHTFDISLHGFPIGMIKSCRRYWDKEIADSIIQLKDIRFVNPQFEVETTFDRENFTEILTEKMEAPAKQVEAFYERINNQEFFMDSDQTTAELLEEYFPGRNDIKRLLLEPIAYANGSTEDDPALVYSIVFSNFMKKGIYTFQGGTDLLIQKMARRLKDKGVVIKKRVSVDRILTNGNQQVTGVEANGQTIRCRAVLSNSNLKHTIFGLIDKQDYSDPSFLEDAEKVRLNSSSCQVYMGIREGETIPNVGDLIFVSDAEHFSSDELKSPDTLSRTFSFYYPDIRPQSKKPRYSVVASTNANWADWQSLSDEEYEAKKQALIETTLATLERFIPDVRDKIDHIEAATPRTIHHYTRHLRGASFGTKYEGLKVSQTLPEKIKGAYHAGSVGIIMSGWLGTINYGVITSAKVAKFLQDSTQESA